MKTKLDWTLLSKNKETACVGYATFIISNVPSGSLPRYSVYVVRPDKYDDEFEVLGRELKRSHCKRIAATYAEENL